jgi:hypothetical protein
MRKAKDAYRVLMREIAFFAAAISTGDPNFGYIRAGACSRGSDGCGNRVARLLKGTIMLDFVMIALGVAFFAASVLYVLACERM